MIYNDIGFRIGSTLLILIESQSTWTSNIIFRVSMFWADLYVIYVGDRKAKPEEISFSKEFFCGDEVCPDLKVKMIYDGKRWI